MRVSGGSILLRTWLVLGLHICDKPNNWSTNLDEKPHHRGRPKLPFSLGGVRAPSNNGCLDQPKSISQTAPRSVHTFCRVVTIKLDRLGKIFEYLEKLKQTRGCLVHFLRLLAVHWPGAQSTRYNHILACNFARYSPILIFFSLTDSARLACFLTF